MFGKIKFLTIAVVVLAFVTAAAWMATNSSARGRQESANGQGTILVQDDQGKTVRRQFSFNARRNADGTVTGKAILHNPSFTGANGKKYQASFDISCLRIDGNTAVLGGVVRRTNDPNLVDAAYFAVQDNGEPGKNRDLISFVAFNDTDPNNNPGDPQACQNINVADFGLFAIESGNIQVRSDATQ